MIFREDWKLSGKQFSLDSEVRSIKFSYDLNFLVVLTANGSLYQITQTKGSYDSLSRSFSLDDDLIISFNLNEELTHIIASTARNKVYTISVKNFKVKSQLE